MDCNLYFLYVLSFRNIAKVLYFLYLVKLSHVSTWNWIQKYNPKKLLNKKKKINEYSCVQKDEAAVKAGSELIWLDWVSKPKNKEFFRYTYQKREICS